MLGLKLCGRCHPIRLIKVILLLVGGFVLLTSLRQYLNEEGLNDGSQTTFRSGHFYQTLGFQTRTIINMSDPKAQLQLDYISQSLDVQYNVAGNEDGRYYVDLILTNRGTRTIEPCCWSIYFYHMKFIDIPSINSGYRALMRSEMAADPNKNQQSKENNFSILHVNSYTFKLQPTNQFLGISSGNEVKLRLFGGGWAVSRGEVLPNWYVANDFFATEPRLILSTVGEEMKFVGEFDTRSKTIRSNDDLFEPFTPDVRYKKNSVRDVKGAPGLILPTPHSIEINDKNDKLLVDGNSWIIVYEKRLQNEANYLKDYLNLPIEQVDDGIESRRRSKEIILYVDESIKIEDKENLFIDHGYSMVIEPQEEKISISGFSPTGVFYGIVSLISLARSESRTKHWFHSIVLVDAPRYGHRGVMVDVVRNFHTKKKKVPTATLR